MIQKISFQNYKAFEKGEIKLKPITILLGANSVGKSSIINLLLMLQQTTNATNYKSAFKLNGENISMGECENIFRNRDTSKELILEFEFSDRKLFEMLKGELMSDLISGVLRPLRFYDENNQTIDRTIYLDKSGEIKKEVFTDKNIFQSLLRGMTKLSEERFAKKNSEKINNSLEDHINSNDETYDFLKLLSAINQDNFILSFEIKFVLQKEKGLEQQSKLLKVSKATLKQANEIVLSIELVFNEDYNGYKAINITSDFASNVSISEKSQKELLQSINYNSTIFSIFPRIKINNDFYFGYNRENYSILPQTIFQIFSQAIRNIENQFIADKTINHISPLRAYPQRYYFLDKANINTYLNSLDGNSLTEILKENKDVRKGVNDWLEKFLRINVNVDTLHDVIHTLKVKQTKSNFDLDITDVGFGISQILPVVAQGFMSDKDSITMIEQPEIHLHPKLQADLADLFIHIVKINNRHGSQIKNISLFKDDDCEVKNIEKCLLIETHSEYLLRRLRRRISEGKISAQDVAIYFIEPPKDENGSAEIQEREISPDGSFEWPQDFYADELREDTTEFIKQLFRKK
ncbi:MAG: AAA family ATPase [Tannerella sp.]|jgi:predicted ATPase|nr:AAA family ATPase [Tannerella sp.]